MSNLSTKLDQDSIIVNPGSVVPSVGKVQSVSLQFNSIDVNGTFTGKIIVRSNETTGAYIDYIEIFQNNTSAGKVNVKDNILGYVQYTVILGKNITSSTASQITFKVSVVSKTNTVESNDYKLSFPTKANLEEITIDVKHNETIPPIVLKDDVTFKSKYINYGNIYYTLDGSEPSSTNGNIYNGSFTISNEVETTIKLLQVCSDVKTDVISETIKHNDVSKRYEAPSIKQSGYDVIITNNQTITDEDSFQIRVEGTLLNNNYDISKEINEITIKPKYDTHIRARLVDKNNPDKNYSDYAELDFVYPIKPPIQLTEPIISFYKKEVDGKTKYYVKFTRSDKETYDYNTVYYSTNNLIPSKDTGVVSINEELEVTPDLIIKYCAYYLDEDTGKDWLSPTATTQLVVNNTNPYYTGYTKPELNDEVVKNYIDIICSINPEDTKSLESIQYVLDEIKAAFGTINLAEQLLSKLDNGSRFSGDSLVLYSDETYSGELNINDDGDTNKLNNYKLPTFQKGHWEFNYFRNEIAKNFTKAELEKVYTKIPITKPDGTTTVITIKVEDVLNSVSTANNNINVFRSDNRSLIYGKYIVARFIFNNDKRVKLQNVTFITNNY